MHHAEPTPIMPLLVDAHGLLATALMEALNLLSEGALLLTCRKSDGWIQR
jgi:hypothetical protein